MADEQKGDEERWRFERYLEAQVDILKHLTTLDSAITVVVLAIFQAGALSGGGVVLSLAFFGASLVIALVSMYFDMLALRFGSVREESVPWGPLLSGSLFLGGLAAFAFGVLLGV